MGLIGCHTVNNYGSMLQTLACQKAIELTGNDCDLLVYKRNYTIIQKIKQVPRVLNGGNQHMITKKLTAKKANKVHPQIAAKRKERDAAFEVYRAKTFTKLSRPYVGWTDLRQGSRDYGAVVVGSDQMWLPQGLPTNYYNLQFVVPGVRRVSYSTSFGVSSVPWYQRSRTSDYLRKIDFLSVREDSGAAICREIGGVEAKVVVDPTLLLTSDQWAEIIPNSATMRSSYIFCYFLGANPLCREEARTLSRATGLPIIVLRHCDETIPSDESFGDEAPYDVDPAGFVNLIRNASYVLTDSFHATVFSAIHHKRFATFYRFAQSDKQSRNSRIDSLLAHLGLWDRLVTKAGRIKEAMDVDADFGAVDMQLDVWRTDSWGFLKEALS